jgi:hypothetical protein
MPCTPHPPRLDHYNYICVGLQVLKLIIMQFSPATCYFFSICPAHLFLLDLSILLLFHTSWIQMFSSESCSQTPSVCVVPLMSETSFAFIQNCGQNCSIVYFKLYVPRRKKRTWSALNFLMNQTWTYVYTYNTWITWAMCTYDSSTRSLQQHSFRNHGRLLSVTLAGCSYNVVEFYSEGALLDFNLAGCHDCSSLPPPLSRTLPENYFAICHVCNS